MRTYAKISKKDFLQNKRGRGGYDAVPATVFNDWSLQAEFDLENCESEVGGQSPDYGKGQTDLLYGVHTIGDFTFCGFLAGGDWELPVFAIAYWDGEHYRGFVPMDGNCFKIKLEDGGKPVAYGNEEEDEDIPKGTDFRDHAKLRAEIVREFGLKETV